MIHAAKRHSIDSEICSDCYNTDHTSKNRVFVTSIPFHNSDICYQGGQLHRNEQHKPVLEHSRHYRVHFNGASVVEPKDGAQEVKQPDAKHSNIYRQYAHLSDQRPSLLEVRLEYTNRIACARRIIHRYLCVIIN